MAAKSWSPGRQTPTKAVLFPEICGDLSRVKEERGQFLEITDCDMHEMLKGFEEDKRNKYTLKLISILITLIN
jgi:hypothetical protein